MTNEQWVQFQKLLEHLGWNTYNNMVIKHAVDNGVVTITEFTYQLPLNANINLDAAILHGLIMGFTGKMWTCGSITFGSTSLHCALME